jgi:hypothetical protein
MKLKKINYKKIPIVISNLELKKKKEKGKRLGLLSVVGPKRMSLNKNNSGTQV